MALGWLTPAVVALSFLTTSAHASQIVSPSNTGVGKTQVAFPLVISAGFEYSEDSEATETEYPFSLEFGFSEQFKAVAEWSYVNIHSKAPTVKSAAGMGDLETFVEYEFIREMRYRPAFSAEFGIKWPTAKFPNLGSGETDYTLGIIVSKEFTGGWDTDFGLSYTLMGDPRGIRIDDVIEVSGAVEWKITYAVALECELVYHSGGGTTASGPAFAKAGALLGGGGSDFELSIGFAENLGDYLKLEQGAVVQPDGSWQALLAVAWDFSGEP